MSTPKVWLLVLLALASVPGALSGCENTDLIDTDGDGSPDIEDCSPADPSVFPGADDAYGDDIDQDCDSCDTPDAGDGLDKDCDGYPANADLDLEDRDLYDCNDNDPDVHPDAVDIPDDGIDQDCDDEDCVDLDDDGFCQGVDDCDDGRADVYLGAPELPDCVDHDCDGTASDGTAGADDDGDGSCEGVDLGAGLQCCEADDEPGDCDDDSAALNLQDVDMDDVNTCGDDGVAGSGDEDCDDGDDDKWPGNDEICDGKDNDCLDGVPPDESDGDNDGEMICEGDCDDDDGTQNNLDEDLDGYSSCNGDCDDQDPTLRPVDGDQDGYSSCTGDCDDEDDDVHPGLAEACDGVDTDCDGALPPDEVDGDSDGYLACEDCDDTDATLNGTDSDGDGWSSCDGDCNDSNAAHNEEATDLVGDGIDQNCDDVDGTDGDGDSWASVVSGGTDCDDDDPAMNPSDSDADGFSTCEGDCDDGDPLLELVDADADGHTTCDGDCVDSDPLIYPHATEIPDDGVDDNCDGLDLCEDLNCDGWTDLVLMNNYDGASYYQDSWIYWGSATGYSPANRAEIPTIGPGGVKVAELDGDGYLDIVVANQRSNATWLLDSYVYWGSPTGYATGDRTDLPTQGGTEVSAGDLDGDGYLDLVFSNAFDNVVVGLDSWIYWGSPTGFSTGDRTDLPTDGAWGNVIEDVDDDGFLDIVFANLGSLLVAAPESWIYWGSAGPYGVGNRTGLVTSGAYGPLVADLNGDGHNELVFNNHVNANNYMQDTIIHWGTPTGFSGTTVFPHSGGTGLNAADLDGDGDLDLVLSRERNQTIYSVDSYIYWNDAGTFTAGNRQALETYGAVVNLVHDLDGDGSLDIFFANWFNDTSYALDSYIYWGDTGVYSDANRTGIPAIGASGAVAAGPGIPVPRTEP
jgi:hypothetical protein